jgi:glutathione reductase (NADPH)
MAKDFNLLVLGGGSGGLATAQKAASFGATVGLVEMDYLGGTCVNRGCIPKKIMWYAAQLAEYYHAAAAYGFHPNDTQLTFEKLVEHRESYIKTLRANYQSQLKKNNIQYIKGKAIFTDKHSITVNGKSYSADHIVIATGCNPHRLPIVGAELAIDSDGFFALQHQPKKAAIIGGGYIAIELASILNQLGTEVIIIFRGDVLLKNFDLMISNTLSTIMHDRGITLLSNQQLTKITRDSSNHLIAHCEHKKVITDLDCVIFATGRQPQTQQLNLNAAGIQTNDKGFIITDQWETTNIPHIYAIGDVAGKKLLTPVAIAAGRQLATRIFGDIKDAHVDYDNIPTVVFSHPPIASIGMSEQLAVERYGRDNIKVYETQFNPLFYALTKEKSLSKIKLITHKPDEKIIGCHLMGIGADEILQGFAVAIKMGATKKDLLHTIPIHPTSAEELITLLN